MAEESPLFKKIQSLEKELQEKKEVIKKYEGAFKDSNSRVEKIIRDIQDSLPLIRKIHQALLPTELPQIPHFEFSYKSQPTKIGISGDFFDVIQLQNPLQFAVLLASCNSYAITSLFLTTLLKFSKDLQVHENSKDFFTELSEKLSPSLTEKDQVHLFCGIVNRKYFTLDYCISGDILAILKPEDLPHQILKATSSSVHKNQQASFKNQSIDLNPRDHLILCSPGIVHRKNPKNQSFGLENLLKSLSLEKKQSVLERRQNILFQANEFAQKKESNKDQTALIVEVKDRIIKLTKKNKV